MKRLSYVSPLSPSLDPDDFVKSKYSIRLSSSTQRKVELFIVVTMYNEDALSFNRTMFGIAQNIAFLCKKNKYGWDADAWKKVAVVIVADGRSKVDEGVLKVLQIMGVYQEGIAQSAVNDQPTTGRKLF